MYEAREETDGKEQEKKSVGDKQQFISVSCYTSAHCPGALVSGVLFKPPTTWHHCGYSSGPRASPLFSINQHCRLLNNLHSPTEELIKAKLDSAAHRANAKFEVLQHTGFIFASLRRFLLKLAHRSRCFSRCVCVFTCSVLVSLGVTVATQ